MSGISPDDHLLRLNDDCFYEIFKNLPIIDWCSMRETCTRLHTISDDCFKRNSKSFKLTGHYVANSPYNDLPMKDIKRLIRNFGQFITKLTVNVSVFEPDENHTKIIPLLDRYCVTLDNLKLVKIDIDVDTIVKCYRLFSRLQKLVIDNCCDDEVTFTTCLSLCGSLTELELIRMLHIEGDCLAKHFKALESFSVKACKDFNYNFLQRFFVQNPQLTSLKLMNCDYMADLLLPDIYNHLPNLEALSLRFAPTFRSFNHLITQLLPLAKLKKFEMDFTQCGLIDLNLLLSAMATRNTIENLHLCSVIINDGFATALSALKSLKILKFTSTSHLDGKLLKALATDLPALTEIHIIECLNTTFNELKEFVEHSTNLNKIVYCRCDERPSVTIEIFLMLIEIMQRKENKVILNIQLNDDDYREIINYFEFDGMLKMLTEQAHLIHLLPLEEEEIATLYEYGAGLQRRRFNDCEDIFGFGDDDIDYYDDGIDDTDEDDDDDFLFG